MTMTTDCYAACDKHLTSILISQFDFSGFLWSQLDFFFVFELSLVFEVDIMARRNTVSWLVGAICPRSGTVPGVFRAENMS